MDRDLRKAKYIKKVPDGRGGWNYEYESPKGIKTPMGRWHNSEGQDAHDAADNFEAYLKDGSSGTPAEVLKERIRIQRQRGAAHYHASEMHEKYGKEHPKTKAADKRASELRSHYYRAVKSTSLSDDLDVLLKSDELKKGEGFGGSHKYVRRVPDGKGGWNYEYKRGGKKKLAGEHSKMANHYSSEMKHADPSMNSVLRTAQSEHLKAAEAHGISNNPQAGIKHAIAAELAARRYHSYQYDEHKEKARLHGKMSTPEDATAAHRHSTAAHYHGLLADSSEPMTAEEKLSLAKTAGKASKSAMSAVSDIRRADKKAGYAKEGSASNKSMGLLYEFDALIKAEGSRGGHIIGHTRGGKPIYESSGVDHHEKMAAYHDKLNRQKSTIGTGHALAARRHREAANAHAHLEAGTDSKNKGPNHSQAEWTKDRTNAANYESSLANNVGRLQGGPPNWIGRKDTAPPPPAKGKKMAKSNQIVVDPLEVMDELLKAFPPSPGSKPKPKKGKVIGRTADGKEVYAADPMSDEEPLEKEDGPGTTDHHKDRALAHLQAAQAHATAANSARKVEAAKDHPRAVQAAQQASEAAMGGKVMKSRRILRRGDQIVDLDSELEIIDLLEKGGIVGGHSPMGGTDGMRQRARIRGERLVKGITGGTIYQGEHDIQGSREGDYRETYARAKTLEEIVEMDPDGTSGNGGLAEWFSGAWSPEMTDVNLPVNVAMAGRQIHDPPLRIIDDSNPYVKQQFVAKSVEKSALGTALNGRGQRR